MLYDRRPCMSLFEGTLQESCDLSGGEHTADITFMEMMVEERAFLNYLGLYHSEVSKQLNTLLNNVAELQKEVLVSIFVMASWLCSIRGCHPLCLGDNMCAPLILSNELYETKSQFVVCRTLYLPWPLFCLTQRSVIAPLVFRVAIIHCRAGLGPPVPAPGHLFSI